MSENEPKDDTTAEAGTDEGRPISNRLLASCPFCGGEAALGTIRYSNETVIEQHWGQDTFHKVNCIKCGSNNLGLVGFRTPELASAHWNTRASEEQLASFEVWAKARGLNLERSHDGTFVFQPAFYSWLGWQQASLKGELYRTALRIITGELPCVDMLLSDKDVAAIALRDANARLERLAGNKDEETPT